MALRTDRKQRRFEAGVGCRQKKEERERESFEMDTKTGSDWTQDREGGIVGYDLIKDAF